jgi:hypothetical protein
MEAVANVGTKAMPKVGANQSFISGRIRTVATFQIKGKTQHEAVVMLPAPDAFSMPAAVAIQSKFRLGNPGDDWSGLVAVGGIPNSWTVRETGEVKESANVRLSVVE